MSLIDSDRLLRRMPKVRGRLEANAPLADFTWFRVGGPAEVLFQPADEADLGDFLKGTPLDIPITVVGVGSNLLVRDGGVPGVVIRLGRPFMDIAPEGEMQLRAGAAALDVRVARVAADHGIDTLTFLRGIPGTIGGALRMNGGAYGGETKDVLVEARGFNRKGELQVLSNADMKYTYRHCGAAEDLIFTSALLRGRPGNRDEILTAMDKITESREAAQPIKARTGGSTFKNPPNQKSWALIDAAGMRGYAIGPAKVSELHCNFLINEGGATAAQIEELGETVRARVKAQTGIELDWEIKRIGIALSEGGAR
jgi:UDP-N-acetylmuramate dehydrogenase